MSSHLPSSDQGMRQKQSHNQRTASRLAEADSIGLDDRIFFGNMFGAPRICDYGVV
jgi:hypothetical protein